MRETTFGAASFEYRLVNYVPNILSDEEVSIAAIIFDSSDREGRRCILRVAPDWRQRVRGLDQYCDLEMLDSFLKEIWTHLLSDPMEMITQLEESLSNTIQISELRRPRLDPMPFNIEAFAASLLQGEGGANGTAVDSKRPPATWLRSKKETVGA